VAVRWADTIGAPRDILVLRALGLGDLLTSFPALRGLRRAYPDARIVLATPEPYVCLALLSGAVDEVDATPELGRLHPRRRPPDLAVNLHGSGPESIADLAAIRPGALLTHRHDAFPQYAGPPWRTTCTTWRAGAGCWNGPASPVTQAISPSADRVDIRTAPARW